MIVAQVISEYYGIILITCVAKIWFVDGLFTDTNTDH